MAGAIAPELFARTSIDALMGMTSGMLEKLGRLTFPMVAEPGDRTSAASRGTMRSPAPARRSRAASPGEAFFYSSGRSSNEAAFLLQLVARAYGTNNVNNCSYYCHQASGVALGMVYGSGTASISLDDLDRADLRARRRREPGEQSPAPHHQARRAPPSRRQGPRREPAPRARARPLSRAVDVAEHALRLEDLRPLSPAARRRRRRRSFRRC